MAVTVPVVESVPALQAVPRIESGLPLSDVRREPPADVSEDRQSTSLQARDSARRQAVEQQQRAAQQHEQAVRRHEQAAQRFDTFVQELHQVATVKTDGDFEKFLTQKLVKRLQGTKSDTQTDTGPSVSADRMRRASQIFRRAASPAAGLKELRKVDPDLAKTLEQER